jgi:hypothetical protein
VGVILKECGCVRSGLTEDLHASSSMLYTLPRLEVDRKSKLRNCPALRPIVLRS